MSKQIGLISDTHGNLPESVLKHFKTCDEIWHAGDIGGLAITDQLAKIAPIRVVYGNIDGQQERSEFPAFQFFMCEQVPVFMIHIGGKPGYMPPAAKATWEKLEQKPKIFICGHSHITRVQYDKKYEHLHMNPGAAGNHGFHQVKTILKFTLDKGEIKNLQLIELGKRA